MYTFSSCAVHVSAAPILSTSPISAQAPVPLCLPFFDPSLRFPRPVRRRPVLSSKIPVSTKVFSPMDRSILTEGGHASESETERDEILGLAD
ncbi:uncharacterized protein EI97DRAFT_428698 [Westerdykella ornata]|uniref:Uncharacterized protein n=1 Tax=Westerdykella ornata TaxID=318751 RepID=A0A6A6JXY2_WESOR|nr:uncharacterized protein EI97DRAFT_428698 [Westerdykella ornata]KAF2280606.1 hypothetical protein EI97DRAFT_428698 [Westerdykella ornata]